MKDNFHTIGQPDSRWAIVQFTFEDYELVHCPTTFRATRVKRRRPTPRLIAVGDIFEELGYTTHVSFATQSIYVDSPNEKHDTFISLHLPEHTALVAVRNGCLYHEKTSLQCVGLLEELQQ